MASNLKEYGAVAGIGAATGLLWSFITGRLDLQRDKDWFYAGVGAFGSAVNSTAIYGVTDYFSRDPQLPLQITSIWWAAQGAASLTNFAGSKFQLESNPSFNAVSVPLNFIAGPMQSSVGMTRGFITNILPNERMSGVITPYGGMLVFSYDVCRVGMTMGNTGHCFNVIRDKPIVQHELLHLKQFSILGDAGALTVALLDGLYDLVSTEGRPEFDRIGFGANTFEQWARDHDDNPRL